MYDHKDCFLLAHNAIIPYSGETSTGKVLMHAHLWHYNLKHSDRLILNLPIPTESPLTKLLLAKSYPLYLML